MSEPNGDGSLRGFHKAYLRGLGQRLPARVHVGKKGIIDSLEREVDQWLLREELVKISFNASAKNNPLPEDLARRTGAAVAGTVGKTALLYRPHPEPERRVIRLPERD